MNKIEKRNALFSEMKAMDELAKKENRSFTEEEKTVFAAKEAEIRQLDAEIEAEERASKVANFEKTNATSADTRSADDFVKSGHLEMRSVLASGKIAKPTKADGINELASIGDGIVDDVNAIPLTGNGAWVAAYKKTNASAAKVTEGSAIGGTGSTYDYVTIAPNEWGVLDEISNQVKKMTPVAYKAAVEKSALIALREYASDVIVTAVQDSKLAEKKYSVALDQDYIRNLVLGFRTIAGKGNVKLYLNQADLMTLGKVRGTSEKKALYEITFDEGSTLSGTIKEGGTAVQFRVIDALKAGVQLFGQPGAIDMPMWDNYEINTDEGGDYFKRNVMGIRGIQTANADLAAYHGMQVINQEAEPSD